MSVKDYPNELDCEHGQLRRSRPICAAEANYAALLARHNALLEAVARERSAERVERKAKGASRPFYGELAWASDNLTKARAEVDRLLENES